MSAGILLSAGESTRMGQLKALLPWRGTTLLAAQLGQMEAAGLSPLLLVLGHRAEDLEAVAAGWGGRTPIRPIRNERYREGKSTSIVAGVAALPGEVASAVVVAVDQPCEAAVLSRLVEAHRESGAGIVVPSSGGRRGHPTLFDRALFPDLLAVTEAGAGLREVMERHEKEVRYVAVVSPLVRVNLNSPEDYQAAFARYGQAVR
ncbi:MAG: nucleotidyltransferase family protein [Chloroflexota bacterium]